MEPEIVKRILSEIAVQLIDNPIGYISIYDISGPRLSPGRREGKYWSFYADELFEIPYTCSVEFRDAWETKYREGGFKEGFLKWNLFHKNRMNRAFQLAEGCVLRESPKLETGQNGGGYYQTTWMFEITYMEKELTVSLENTWDQNRREPYIPFEGLSVHISGEMRIGDITPE